MVCRTVFVSKSHDDDDITDAIDCRRTSRSRQKQD
jgi:hypothetical protein